ncbi:bifunctional 2',3'-cyclic-nucleotide 2'-phosphodiesterase/3'-nucleotidase [Solimonas marina]|uniref:bifunctional 2',3'-cyclic-nucleotide 2'-phosphodiesterase/3'-nucleotidase n=1 Tax=Solimonas marina TaxID=2714601 RepID=UPI00344ED67A
MAVGLLSWLAACHGPSGADADVQVPANGSTLSMALLETTDLHSNVLSYDYYRAKPDPTLGFERTATLIDSARHQYPNNVLLDAGDTIQGTVLADYEARVENLPCKRELAVYRAMDALGYDGGTIGNHEFNYGLDYLGQVTGAAFNVENVKTQHCAGPHYPLVLSNVYSDLDGKPLYPPYAIVQKTFEAKAPDGHMQKVTLRIGLLGFTPPQITDWDRLNLQRKINATSAVDAAKRWLPELQGKHPDLIVALVHGGPDASAYTPKMENPAWYLAGVPGIDAILMGHMHKPFPGAFADLPGVDEKRGLIRGVPAVMAGMWGKYLGVIHLDLKRENGKWKVDTQTSNAELQPICPASGDCVAPDPRIRPLVQEVHEAAVEYLQKPIGSTGFRLSSYFSDVGDESTLALVNAVQLNYVRRWIAENRPSWRQEPLLSASASFKTGYAGPDDYTDIAPGAVSRRSAADLYQFSNTMAAVRIDGNTLRRWLELSAERYQRLDPATREPQDLINNKVAGFNVDHFAGAGLHYVIDPSQPEGQRITELSIDGKPIAPTQMVIVATNNYRASSSPVLKGRQTILSSQDDIRGQIVEWLKQHPHLKRSQLPSRAWSFAPLHLHGPLRFDTAAGKAAVARAAGLPGIREREALSDGRARYTVDLRALH